MHNTLLFTQQHKGRMAKIYRKAIFFNRRRRNDFLKYQIRDFLSNGRKSVRCKFENESDMYLAGKSVLQL